MRAFRGLLLLTGVGFGLWGLWLMRDFRSDQLTSTGVWLVGGVIAHDAILAPLTVLLGVVGARLLPNHARAMVAGAFIVWGTVTIAVANVLLGQGGKPDNDMILGRPYVLAWLVFTALLVLAASAAIRYRRPAA